MPPHAQELGRLYPSTTVSWTDSATFYAVHGTGRVAVIIIRRDLRNPQLALMIEPLEILEIFGMIHPTLQNPSIHERKVGWISNNLPSWPTSSKLFSMPMSSMNAANNADLPS